MQLGPRDEQSDNRQKQYQFRLKSIFICTALIAAATWCVAISTWSPAERVIFSTWFAAWFAGLFHGRLTGNRGIISATRYATLATCLCATIFYFLFARGIPLGVVSHFLEIVVPIIVLTIAGVVAALISATLYHVIALCVAFLFQSTKPPRQRMALFGSLVVVLAGGGVSGWWFIEGSAWTPSATLSAPNVEIAGMAISPDGHTLAVGTETSDVELWDIANGIQVSTHKLELNNNISTILFTRDGQQLICATDMDPRLFVYSLDPWGVDTVISSRTKWGYTQSELVNNGANLLTVARDVNNNRGSYVASLWDATTWTETRRFTLNITGWDALVCYDRKVFAFFPSFRDNGPRRRAAEVWSLETGQKLMDGPHRNATTIFHFPHLFSPDGELLIDNSTSTLWNMRTGTVTQVPSPAWGFTADGHGLIISFERQYFWRSLMPTSFEWIPILGPLAKRPNQSRVAIYDLRTERITATSAWVPDITNISLSADRSQFVTANRSTGFSIWKVP